VSFIACQPWAGGALRLDAVRVEVELVVVDREAALLGDLVLALLDLGVVELLDAPALKAHEVVVVPPSFSS
jgi:hypothetical protein